MYEIWLSTTSGGVPMSRQSKLETTRLDNGSKNKRATLSLFGRFTGKKAPANSLRDWLDLQSQLALDIQAQGYACDKAGVRRIARERIDDLIEVVERRIDSINQARDAFLNDAPHLKEQILDSYLGDDCYYEVEEALARWHPNPNKMTPIFGVSDLLQGTGLVQSSRVEEAILKSELATRKSMVEILEAELHELFKRCDSPERVRSQLKDAEGLLNKLAPVVREFSSSPDLVEKLDKGLEALKQIPLSKDGLISNEGQSAVERGLEIFEATTESEPEITPEVTFDEDDCVVVETGEPEAQPQPTKPLTYSMEWDDEDVEF